MQTVSLTPTQSWELGALLLVGGGVAALVPQRAVRAVGALAREVAVIGFLYGLWQFLAQHTKGATRGAFAHAHTIMRIEHDLRLPSEHDIQRLLLHSDLVVRVANLYYATMHFTMMFVFLLWLFVRHRDRYRPIRQVLAWTTLACLLVQTVPVAPPRMLPGFVDTALRDGQSVYSQGLPVDQLSAMPSVHVAWAVLIGWYVARVSPSRWRWIGPLHAVITVLVVVGTANHWWLDGIVAVALLSACAWGVHGGRAAWHAAWPRVRRARTGAPDPVRTGQPA